MESCQTVQALASLLNCREGQAYSLVVAALLAAALAVLGLPPVLSHRAHQVANLAEPHPTPAVASGVVPIAPSVSMSVGSAAPPAGPSIIPGQAPVGAAGIVRANEPAPSGRAAVLYGREGTILLRPVPVRGTVATLSNTGGRSVTAAIDWGDGATPSKAIVSRTSGDGAQLKGEHTYQDDGTYRITVTIAVGATTVVVLSRAQIAEPPDALNQALDRVSELLG